MSDRKQSCIKKKKGGKKSY